MPHLDSERLAALADELPTPEELAHLSACAECRTERASYEALLQRAVGEYAHAETSRVSDWDSLSVALRREGLLTSASDAVASESPLVVRALDGSSARITRGGGVTAAAGAPRALPMWMQAAAAIALMATGVVAGRWSASARTDLASGTSGRVATAARDGATSLQPASRSNVESFASVAQATEVLTTAQREYERASLWLAANDTTVRSPDVYRARLAALDQMMAASRAALRDAPQDPVLNHYFLSASTAREATLQQLSSALPVDKTIEGY